MGSDNKGWIISIRDIIYFLMFLGILFMLTNLNKEVKTLTNSVDRLSFWTYVRFNQIWSELKFDTTKVNGSLDSLKVE